MSATTEDRGSSYTMALKSCACIEFRLDEHHRHGFHTSQLIEYSLEPNPEAEHDRTAPPERLQLAFSTADVLLLGWRLDGIADRLQENTLASVRILHRRYVDMEPARCCVTFIRITQIQKALE